MVTSLVANSSRPSLLWPIYHVYSQFQLSELESNDLSHLLTCHGYANLSLYAQFGKAQASRAALRSSTCNTSLLVTTCITILLQPAGFGGFSLSMIPISLLEQVAEVHIGSVPAPLPGLHQLVDLLCRLQPWLDGQLSYLDLFIS